MTPFETALARIDAANSADPNTVVVDGVSRPAELVYSERMTDMLARFAPEASEALKLAARGQHIKRWTVPRSSYPMDRAGYHRWRGELKRRHAEWTRAVLDECGIPPDTAAHVGSLIRKENLKTDPEAQTLEDVACLVFLQHYAMDFSAKHDREKMIGILQKTWKKMSERGRDAALSLPLHSSLRDLVVEAISSAGKPLRNRVPLCDVAVILAAHGDRGGSHPNETIQSHAAALSADRTFHSVAPGLLRGEPQLEDAVRMALQAGARALAVYPMFMAEGYFTSKVLIQRLAALEIPIDVHVLPPLGADPRLPALMLETALATSEHQSLTPETTRLLLVGHGSKIGPASANATRAVATAIAGHARFQRVESAFLEEPEFLDDALLREKDRPTVVLGFFSGDGLHAGEDVPQAIRETGARAIYAGSIGASTELRGMIRSSLCAALSTA